MKTRTYQTFMKGKFVSFQFPCTSIRILITLTLLCGGAIGGPDRTAFSDEKQPDAVEKITENTLKYSKDAPSATATAADFDFLSGYWVGTGFGGDCEETWMPAIEGTRIGTFRFHQDGKLVFSEFFQLAQHGDRWSLRLRHFDEELKGWEEKDKFVEFPLVRVEKNTAWFNGLTYQLLENGELHVMLAMKHKDGSFTEEKFIFKKRPLTVEGSR